MPLGLVLSLSLLQNGEPFLRYPDIHGDKVVFTSEGDLWLGSLSTGEAKRLTNDAGVERNASFSPDGTKIAFEGEYDGQRQAYVIPVTGGVPKQVTSVEGFRAVTGWTSDGSQVVVRYAGVPTNYTYGTVPYTGGALKKLPIEFASHVAYGPGNAFTFTRFNRWYMNWFRYIGGMQNQIWTYTPGNQGNAFKSITSLDGTNEFPVWIGDRIYFVNEKNGQFTLMSVPTGGGKTKVELPASAVEIRELSSDGKRLIYEKGQSVEVFDPTTSKSQPLKLSVESDLIHMRSRRIPAEANVLGGTLTASGKRALIESRGQILSVPAGEGEARVWKAKAGVRYRHPSMSKDAKKVAFISDESGDQQVYIANADGSDTKQLTKDTNRQLWGTRFSPDGKWIATTDSKMNIRVVNTETGEDKVVANIPFTWFAAPMDFSPDSKYLAYSQTIPVTYFGQIEVFEIATGKTVRVSNGRTNDTLPVFSVDGRFLAFSSVRSLNVTNDTILNQLNNGPTGVLNLVTLKKEEPDLFAPKDAEEGAPKPPEKPGEFRIDFDGLYSRRIELPLPAADYSDLGAVGNRLVFSLAGNVKFFDLMSKTSGDLAPGTGFTIAPDSQNLMVTSGPTATVMAATGDNKQPLNFGGLRLEVEPVQEWKQIFWDAWRHLRDYFYVENMHGLDWKKIGEKYSAFLPSVRSRDELDELIRWMQSEIGSSHQYLSPGDAQDLKPRIPGAYLGCEVEATSTGFFKISKIFKGDGFRIGEQSPLLGVGKDIREGMYLVAVGGEQVRVGQDPFRQLQGRAGRTISIVVNDKASAVGGKTYYVKPVASEQRMRYLDWVEQNRLYVEKASGGRLGYLHLAAMMNSDMNDFIKQYFYQRNKEGFVIDSRFNNGGNIQDMVNRILNSSLTGFFNMRNSSLSWTRQSDYFEGPMVVVQNEFNISCGEEFPHRFKDLKRGLIVGRRTMGGEVGSSPGWPLVDGGVVSVPNYGMWTRNGWVIEGSGVSPDVDVQSDPNAFIVGKDPQLDESIKILLEALRKNPPKPWIQPADRNRVSGGK